MRRIPARATLRLSWPPASLRLDLRAALVCLALTALALAGTVAHLVVGEYTIPPLDVIRTLLGLQTDDGSHAFIVETLRLPRALVALMVGLLSPSPEFCCRGLRAILWLRRTSSG